MSSYEDRLNAFLPSRKDIKIFSESDEAKMLSQSFDRTLIWISLLSKNQKDVCCEVLLPSLHSKIIEISALVPIGLFHSTYSSLRTMIDISTAYSFYVTHPVEWKALCEGKVDWMGRELIIRWHVNHTTNFKEYNTLFGIQDKLKICYRELSMYIHAIPVEGLPMLLSLDKVDITLEDLKNVIETAKKVDKYINMLFIPLFNNSLTLIDSTEKNLILSDLDRTKLAKANIIIS